MGCPRLRWEAPHPSSGEAGGEAPLLFSSGSDAQRVGRGSPSRGGQFTFLSLDSNVNLTRKCPHRHTQRNAVPGTPGPAQVDT